MFVAGLSQGRKIVIVSCLSSNFFFFYFQNILEDLQKNFDDEKAQILRNLSKQKDKAAQERQRQIELAKLKRDQRKMEKGEKMSEVAMLIHESKEQDRKREQTLVPCVSY